MVLKKSSKEPRQREKRSQVTTAMSPHINCEIVSASFDINFYFLYIYNFIHNLVSYDRVRAHFH